jgi:hypothetical protein
VQSRCHPVSLTVFVLIDKRVAFPSIGCKSHRLELHHDFGEREHPGSTDKLTLDDWILIGCSDKYEGSTASFTHNRRHNTHRGAVGFSARPNLILPICSAMPRGVDTRFSQTPGVLL